MTCAHTHTHAQPHICTQMPCESILGYAYVLSIKYKTGYAI